MDDLTPEERLMAEVAANLIAITEEEARKIVEPPGGPMSEVGYYHTLNKKNLRRKELDAVQHLLDQVAFNTASMLFALLDGKLETEEALPAFTLVNKENGEPLSGSLYEAFRAIWEEEESDS